MGQYSDHVYRHRLDALELERSAESGGSPVYE